MKESEWIKIEKGMIEFLSKNYSFTPAQLEMIIKDTKREFEREEPQKLKKA